MSQNSTTMENQTMNDDQEKQSSALFAGMFPAMISAAYSETI